MTLVRRSTGVPAASDYGEYRDDLRYDFWYSCAYCTITELEATSIGFQIDHYEPQDYADRVGPSVIANVHAYENLMWSCEHCNRAKTDHPMEKARAEGYRFFRPDKDDAPEHFELNGHSIIGTTNLVGAYTAKVLRLNSLNKRRLREIREELHHSRDAMLEGARALGAIALDQLPLDVRGRFEQAKTNVKALSTAAGELRHELFRSVFASANRAPDPTREEDDKARRKYLREIERAVVPHDHGAAPTEKAQTKPETTAKKKKKKR